jgi:hypothetical protein
MFLLILRLLFILRSAGGGLYPHARGDERREETHARFQEELARLSARGRRQVGLLP